MTDGQWIAIGLIFSSCVTCYTVLGCFRLWLKTPRHVHNTGRVNNVNMTPEQYADWERSTDNQ